MTRGSAPYRLLKHLADQRTALVTRRDALAVPGISDPDRALRRLVREGLVDKLDRGLWLVPSRIRPILEVPRLWSNPGQDSPDTIIAVTVANPTIGDITRLILAYGRTHVVAVLDAMLADGEIHPRIHALSARMIRNSMDGIRNAAHRLAA